MKPRVSEFKLIAILFSCIMVYSMDTVQNFFLWQWLLLQAELGLGDEVIPLKKTQTLTQSSHMPWESARHQSFGTKWLGLQYLLPIFVCLWWSCPEPQPPPPLHKCPQSQIVCPRHFGRVPWLTGGDHDRGPHTPMHVALLLPHYPSSVIIHETPTASSQIHSPEAAQVSGELKQFLTSTKLHIRRFYCSHLLRKADLMFAQIYVTNWFFSVLEQIITTNVTLPSKMSHIDTFHEILILTRLYGAFIFLSNDTKIMQICHKTLHLTIKSNVFEQNNAWSTRLWWKPKINVFLPADRKSSHSVLWQSINATHFGRYGHNWHAQADLHFKKNN